ncbi:uncharacterized protein CDAR_615451 [Caerostris darwini]|uniref:Uncharacterized protein n=1 Tax=Caerostris darwini TaxID=1538125 RepID=A0AAV4RZC4_9ARAC|nr:uncharacterized protein CDAR_615451 [Caerostris darwini]
MVLLTSPDYDRMGPKNFLGDPEKGPEAPGTRPGSSVSTQRPRGLYIPNEEFRSRYSHYLSSRDASTSNASPSSKGNGDVVYMKFSVNEHNSVWICLMLSKCFQLFVAF